VHRKIRSDRTFAFVHCNVSSPYLRSTSTSHDLKSKTKEESSFHISICGRWSADRSISNFFLGAGIFYFFEVFFSFTSTVLLLMRTSEIQKAKIAEAGRTSNLGTLNRAASQHILTKEKLYMYIVLVFLVEQLKIKIR